jgi:uncharacterized membrane protein YdcZ (DUF606 family)
MVLRWIANLAWMVAGVLVFAVCIDIFGGYPSWHSEALDWIAVLVVMAGAAVVWVRHERTGERHDHDG